MMTFADAVPGLRGVLTANGSNGSLGAVPHGINPFAKRDNVAETMTPRQPADPDSPVRTGLLVALIVGLPFAVFAPRIAPLVGAIGLIAVLVLIFNGMARVDRTAFVSIAIPVGAVALIGLALPWRLAVALDEAAAIFLGLFAFAPGSFVPWWWRVVLRRPKVAFALRLASQIREVSRLTTELLAGQHGGGRARASIEEQIDRLRSLPAPDPDWTQLRNDYADECEAILELGWRSAGAQEYLDETVHADALRARFDELVRGS
jgi:hypothetical protein